MPLRRAALGIALLVAAPALAQQPAGEPPPGYPPQEQQYPPQAPQYPPQDSPQAPLYPPQYPPGVPVYEDEPPPQAPPFQLAPPVAQEGDDEPPPCAACSSPPSPVFCAPPVTPPRARSGAAVELSAGPSLRSLWGAPIGGADMAIHIGGEGPRGAWKITTTLLVGATDHHLPVEQVQWGFAAEGNAGRMRFGGGGQFGLLVVHRITQGDAMTTPTFGIYGTASVDLGSAGARVMPFLSLRLGADALPIDGTAIFDGALSVGIRL